MKTFKLNFLEFVRTKFCIIVYLAVNATIAVTSIYRMFFDTMSARLFVPDNLSQIQALSFNEYNLHFAAIVFIMFLFTSHYYFSQARKNEFLECASVTATGKNGFILNQFSVMLTLALITCAVSFLLSIIFSFKDPNADGAYFLYSAKISILYFFLANIIAILIGLLCSTIKKTAAAYLILIISSFVFSPMTSRLTGEIYNKSDESIYPLWRIFEIFQNTSYETAASGINANIKSLSIIVFWISCDYRYVHGIFIQNKASKANSGNYMPYRICTIGCRHSYALLFNFTRHQFPRFRRRTLCIPRPGKLCNPKERRAEF